MPDRPLDTDGLQELLWGFAAHRVLTVSARTGVLGALAVAATTTDEIAARLDLDPLATRKVVRALNALGIAQPAGDGYCIAPALAASFAPGPDDLTLFLEHSHDLYDRWGENLERWLRGQPWAGKRRDPSGVARFGEAMRAMASQIAGKVVAALDLAGVRRLLDVGGGTGTYARTFCLALPTIEAVVLDIEEVAAIGRRQLAGTPLEDRIAFVGGDYHETDYGTGFDLVLLANVLHQELPDKASGLISRAAAALAPGGRVVVVDFAIDDQHRNLAVGALFAINMRSFGDTHDEPTIRSWLEAAGLRPMPRIDLGATRWIISGHKHV